MKLLNLKVTYEWYTPGGRRRTIFDFASGINQKIAIDNIRKIINPILNNLVNLTVTIQNFL